MTWDVIAKERTTGYYVLVAMIPHNAEYPEDMIIIARGVTEQEAQDIMDQYPQATQAKC